MRDDVVVERETEGSEGMPFGQSAGTFNSHLVWTQSPQALHVLPCLLKPQMVDSQYPHWVGIEKEDPLNA